MALKDYQDQTEIKESTEIKVKRVKVELKDLLGTREKKVSLVLEVIKALEVLMAIRALMERQAQK